jgi:hypothetical protein
VVANKAGLHRIEKLSYGINLIQTGCKLRVMANAENVTDERA